MDVRLASNGGGWCRLWKNPALASGAVEKSVAMRRMSECRVGEIAVRVESCWELP